MKPLIRAVVTLQLPKPRGLNIGAINPATIARIDFDESVTIEKCRLNVSRNHTTIEAMNMIVNALCRKSFALSHMSCSTFFAEGIL